MDAGGHRADGPPIAPPQAAAGRPVVMGVLNVTPDSFSDGGRWAGAEEAIRGGLELAAQGADIVDVGGESTRPGAERVPAEIEQQRVLPVVAALAASGVRVSIDTMNAATAAAAVREGASIVNDVSGGLADPAMASAVAATGAWFIASHWRGHSATMQQRADYDDVVLEVRVALRERVQALEAAGIPAERLVLDPGLGFAKRAEHNWSLLAGLPQLRSLGLPLLLGASRKRFLADLLPPDAEPADRDEATAVVSALAAREGVWGLRVHDVRRTRHALAVATAWESGRATVSRAERRPADAVDRITLTGLRAFAHHGVFAHERRQGQPFVLDLDVELDLAGAAAGDDLSRTVHYGELAQEAVAAVERDPVDLIETVAERVAGVALQHRPARRVTVTVHKPDAPITVPFADVSVTIVRERS